MEKLTTVGPSDLATQAKLKAALQDGDAAKLEQLVAALIGNLLGVGVAVAKSGFQHGADAGTAGRQGRRLRIECKRYADATSLSDRELLGEVDHAIARDPALEAWILAATKEVPEQIEQDLEKKADSIGVPIVVLDFKASGVSSLATLCSHAPELVHHLFSRKAAELAAALKPTLAEAVEHLKRELAAWQLGFDALRTRSLSVLDEVWNDPRASTATLGQNAAGGAAPQRIRRRSVHQALDDWWAGPAKTDAPGALVGWDGVGKTWAAFEWLVDRRDLLPILLVVPSSAVPGITVSENGLRRFLADRLQELARVRDREHWVQRLDNLLKRPTSEGPVLTIFFDGLNQEASVAWLALLKLLQAKPFAGQVRVLVSTRRLHFETKLSNLRGLVVAAVSVPVDVYDIHPGGELDQLLALHGLERSALRGDLIELARTPRLFRLVIKLHSRLADAAGITVHRLLWEYGRDSFGERTGGSFSETEWKEWLREVATRYRDGVREFSLRSLGETATRPDLTEREVYARLSDIVDGRFAVAGPSGAFQLRPEIVAHALAAGLLSVLEAAQSCTFEALNVQLNQWLDPISDFDQRAEILRAAVSIWLERGGVSTVTGVLVTAWLQTQNIPDTHRTELADLAVQLPDALLDTIEHSDSRTHASARSWAIQALRSIERTSDTAFHSIIARLKRWCSVVSRELSLRLNHADFDRNWSERLRSRVGVDASGPLEVLGVKLEFVDQDDNSLAATAATLLEGFALANASVVFETAAIATAVGRHDEGWRGLKWLVLLNENDATATVATLRTLSNEIRNRPSEPGVNPDLARRVAAMLLWLTGSEVDDAAASILDPGLDRLLEYDRDYLAHPAQSVFPLERRHAIDALNEQSLRLLFRIQRTREFWLDPTFLPPQHFVDELRSAVAEIDVAKLDRSGSATVEDHAFEELEPALARCAPDLLVTLAKRKMRGYRDRTAEERYWVSIQATSHFLVAAAEEGDAARYLRVVRREDAPSNELYAASQLLLLELRNKGALEQGVAIIEAGLDECLTAVAEALRPLSKDEADSLIRRFAAGSRLQRRNLLFVLANDRVDFSPEAWRWLWEVAFGDDEQFRGIAHRALALSDARRFGSELALREWAWSARVNHWENDYGSEALIEGTRQMPFDQIAPRVAPWRLLEAARRRGADPSEVRLACTIVGRILFANGLEDPDPGALLCVDRSSEYEGLFRYSVTPIERGSDSMNPADRLRQALDTQRQVEAHQRAADVAVDRVRVAREAGADLYLADVPADDMEIAIIHCPDLVSQWLEGCDQLTTDFARRIHLAEGAFLSMCEALLKRDPARGAALFRALRQTLTTRFVGTAGVDELVQLVFRVPETPESAALLDDLSSLANCHSDQDLFNFALAATLNGREAWLRALLARDEASEFEWRKRRSICWAGFLANNVLPVDGAWPEGEVDTDHDALRGKAARHRYVEACAHHWWRSYLTAANSVDAYAAWVLFLRSADRRAWTWIGDAPESSDSSDLGGIKSEHFRLNRSRLNRAMEKREDQLDRQFLGRDVVAGVGPWS